MKLALAATLFATASAFAPQPAFKADTSLNVSINPNVGSPVIGSRALKSILVEPNTSEAKKRWDKDQSIVLEGNTLRTWSYPNPAVERVCVNLKSDGRPVDADVDLWQGPDNTPVKCRVYSEDGKRRPFKTVVETPRGPNTLAVRNVGEMEFPLIAQVTPDCPNSGAALVAMSRGEILQGGAIKTWPFDASIDSVELVLRTDGRPLNARLELLNGPNNNKQVVEIYTEDGMDRPFYMEFFTPGAGNTVRIVNTSPLEFPLMVTIAPKEVNNNFKNDAMILGGDSGWSKDFNW
jgi:hypothetical protein